MSRFLSSFISILFLICNFHFKAQQSSAVTRKGLLFGIAGGMGYSSIQFPNTRTSDVGFALDVKLGYMLNPKLALVLTSNVTVYDYQGFGRNRKRDFGILAPSLQYFVSNRFWVLAGCGLGGDNPVFWDIKNPETDPLESKYYNGFGMVVAAGYELFQRKNAVVDFKLKCCYRRVQMQEGHTSGFTPSLSLGVNLY